MGREDWRDLPVVLPGDEERPVLAICAILFVLAFMAGTVVT